MSLLSVGDADAAACAKIGMGEGGCLVKVLASNQQLQRQHATVAARGRGRCCSPSPSACSCVLPVACRRQRPKHHERHCCTDTIFQRPLHRSCRRPLARRLGQNCNALVYRRISHSRRRQHHRQPNKAAEQEQNRLQGVVMLCQGRINPF